MPLDLHAPLDYFANDPSLPLGKRPRLLDTDDIARLAGILLVVCQKLACAREALVIQGMPPHGVDRDYNGLFHLVTHHSADLLRPWRLGRRLIHGFNNAFTHRLSSQFRMALFGRATHSLRQFGLDFPLCLDRFDARDVFPNLSRSRRRRQLADRLLETETPPLRQQVRDLLIQSRIVHCSNFGGLHATTSSTTPLSSSSEVVATPMCCRSMNRQSIGIFIPARRRASSACAFGTPATSNKTRPGLTTATQYSGLPLPDPMRVSAGLCVTGLSGKMRIQTLPPRFR